MLQPYDFGLSKESIDSDQKTYSFCGTVEYMAPEVVNRRVSETHLISKHPYEMLTGNLPFHGQNRKETMTLILNTLGKEFIMNYEYNGDGHSLSGRNYRCHNFYLCVRKPTLTASDETHYFDPEFTRKTPRDFFATRLKSLSNVLWFSFHNSSVFVIFHSSSAEHQIHDHFCWLNDSSFQDLGVGTYSVCKRCIHKITRAEYAVKVIAKSKKDPSEEVDVLLRYSHHANIVKLFAVYEDEVSVYLVEELCRGGELLSRIIAQRHFSEREAAAVMLKLANAVSYLHANQVVHRDLKPSNVMYASAKADADSIRIIDFGFAKQLRAENGLLMTPCYTAQFVAPEVLKKQGYD
uniref:Protein kinase domain-containing protein n=1 Tax=Parascaris equorum TaxID=6256 RepID=A0A914RUU4_PAREQ